MGVILQFTGGKKCRSCGRQIDPMVLRTAPRRSHCDACLAVKAGAEASAASYKRLTMDDIAKIMGYRTPH